MQRSSYQVFDQIFQLLLGLTNGVLLPHDGDQFLLGVIRRWEDDAGTRPVPNTANIGPATADQKLMVLWFGLELSCEVVDLLKRKEEIQRTILHLLCSFTITLYIPSSNFSLSTLTHLLFSQLQQLFPGPLHLPSGASDGDLI